MWRQFRAANLRQEVVLRPTTTGDAGGVGQAGLADAGPAAVSGNEVLRFSEKARTERPGLRVCGFCKVAIVARETEIEVQFYFSASCKPVFVSAVENRSSVKEWCDSPALLMLGTRLPAYIRRSAAMQSDSASDAS